MTKFYDAVYSFERVRGYQFVKLYISMFGNWLESPQWLLAVSKPEVRMRVTSAWVQEWVGVLGRSKSRHLACCCLTWPKWDHGTQACARHGLIWVKWDHYKHARRGRTLGAVCKYEW